MHDYHGVSEDWMGIRRARLNRGILVLGRLAWAGALLLGAALALGLARQAGF